MTTIGRIENLAEGEEIKSARFMGDTGYFVTYENTDPLFSVDLSDPENPKITGKLKITGFSEYLHFYGQNRLLGIGWETDPDSGSVGFNKVSRDSDGNNVRTFINATIYGKVKVKDDNENDSDKEVYNYYVDKNAFKEGDAIVKDDSNQRFIVGETDSLEGVYCINQGYAVFRQVDILDQNEEYAIISSSTSYGLSRYDRIARDSAQVKAQDILY